MHHLRDLGTTFPFLVVAPLSTVQHWRREIEEWTDLFCCVYHDSGGEKSRKLIREFEWCVAASSCAWFVAFALE